MEPLKPYQHIPIHECGEPLTPLPLESVSVVTPHPYQLLGAPYGDRSPYWLRKSVTESLLQAQKTLQSKQPGWQLQIFDAYRPIPVQQFMVDYTARHLAQQQGQDFNQLSEPAQQSILAEVYQFWAAPSHNPNTPPPHSTGAAVDLTVVDEKGQPVDMGSPIDEVSPRSHPDYFQNSLDLKSQKFHHHRCQLCRVLVAAGFKQHPNEWWHFSQGDQLWAWLSKDEKGQAPVARYGRV
ncbi:MAG: D-alanyl-D-alanine dipeptidase [Leptolyngbya sp. SIO1D8]|nr:D-alanyl-D-alanine dipeptidase [Leptolyngbya sp. SIO1D8]